MYEKLMILGNGFDLQASLRSSYDSFFCKRFDEKIELTLNKLIDQYSANINAQYIHKTNYDFIKIIFDTSGARTTGHLKFELSDFKKTFNSDDLTFWDLIFYISKTVLNPDWNVIEAQIRNFMYDNTKYKFNAKTCFSSQIDFLDASKVNSIFAALFPENRWKQYSNYYDFLFRELKLLEFQFASFLNEQIDQNHLYPIKCENLIKRLLIDSRTNEFTTELKVINFNYTQSLPFSINSSKDKLAIDIRSENIHGSLSERNVIFGIDPKGIDVSDSVYKFSKTYRQLTDSSNLKNRMPLLDRAVQSEIIFYGHSLSSLDYSYFQAIFDYFSIYNSSTILRFYFTPHSGKSSDEASSEEVAKVLHLLNTYADTLDNKNHGDNLISKLLIENRLHVDEISP